MADILRAPIVVTVKPAPYLVQSIQAPPPIVLSTAPAQPLLWAASQL